MIPVLHYVISAPYFWLSMGMTTAIAMFVGAILYDGDLSVAWKGIISIGLYAFFILQTSFTRLSDLALDKPDLFEPTRYGGIVSVGFITFFWILGIVIGVATVKYLRRKE